LSDKKRHLRSRKAVGARRVAKGVGVGLRGLCNSQTS
jgi:hypothetical protein